jgi:hypothetical protein
VATPDMHRITANAVADRSAETSAGSYTCLHARRCYATLRWASLALLPKIKKMPSPKAAITYLSKTPATKGGREVDGALAKLKKRGYIKKVS